MAVDRLGFTDKSEPVAHARHIVIFFDGHEYPYLVVDTRTWEVDDAYEILDTARMDAERLNRL